MEYNKQINPKDETGTYVIQLMPSRARQIKEVVGRDAKNNIGGATNLASGTVFIPTANNAFDRTVRYHEALHAAHSDRKRTLKDMLDQALEDGRLHRYCSKAASSEFQRARRDELTVALKDLRGAKRITAVTPNTSLVVFRALAILSAGKIAPRHQRLLDSVIARFGENAKNDFQKALKLLADQNNWDAARKPLKQYFKNKFEKNTPAPEFKQPKPQPKNQDQSKQDFAQPPSLVDEDEKEEQPEESEEESKEGDSKEEKESEKESEEEESGSKESDDSDEDEDKESDSKESDEEDEESEDDEEESDDSNSNESDEDSDEEDEDIADADSNSDEGDESDEDGDDSDMQPLKTQDTSKPRKSHDPDVYTADLTPQIDKENFERMTNARPLKIFIRRLDMGINRVKLSMGRRAPLPVTSGRRILAKRLAGAMSNPSSHVFARSVSQGGFGTILIDASGSMSIPEQALKDFLAKAPALTLAFYNAPDDDVLHGNIFIYAANGYRASVERIRSKDYYGEGIEHYGSGNVIDYHAMAWLLKQPAPHYIVTDMQWTGPWRNASSILCRKLVLAQQLIVVPNLVEMGKILEETERKAKHNLGGRK